MFAGCTQNTSINTSNAIEMQVDVGSNYISQNFSFPANVNHFKKIGATDEEIDEYLSLLNENISKKVWQGMFLSYYAIYALKPNNDYVLGGDNVKVERVQYNSSLDKICFAFRFNSVNAWNYYHPKSEENSDGNSHSGQPFLDINSSTGVFPFSQELEGQKIGNIYQNILSFCQQQVFDQEKCYTCPPTTFCYDYVTLYKRVHSNADKVANINGKYHHVWQCDQSQLNQNKKVKLTTINAERQWWYLLVFDISMAVVALSSLGIWLVERKKKSKKSQ